MKSYIDIDEWRIVESEFKAEYNTISESLCSLGNGHFGQRGCFEEDYSGETLPGNYVAGIYYPDKTRVGWWKNGYPEYFAKVLNGCDWTKLRIQLGSEFVDLHTAKEISSFSRILDMQEGVLYRNSTLTLNNGAIVKIRSERFCSMHNQNLAALNYQLGIENFEGELKIELWVDNDVHNQDANYDEQFWLAKRVHSDSNCGFVQAKTKKTGFHVSTLAHNRVTYNGEPVQATEKQEALKVGHIYTINCSGNSEVTILKKVCIVNDMNEKEESHLDFCRELIHSLDKYELLKKNHIDSWKSHWNEMDIQISGDPKAQQGIRFNIFQLFQTYTGHDHRLNIGPKGFTGEKYGGSTYWDTEAYCLPFYLGTARPEVARNLLIYRYHHLEKAIENAAKLGFSDGAALYPMVTMNGEECHNEWEITFEEIHRNGAIAYAIYDYIRYTGDKKYLVEYGLEVLIAIARFWEQRVNFSKSKNKYVILGVTGPNEYENNVNNNWYTNYMAKWCMEYAMESIAFVKNQDSDALHALFERINFRESEEILKWKDICHKMYFPFDKKNQVFLQQDGFLDKDLSSVDTLSKKDRPINQNWSWDRILRSCFIKQADVLQGLYFFEDEFSEDVIRRNFEFYEPMTVHESSLSPCVHSILASSLGMKDKAYEMYLRTSRLDIDDYNNDTEDGCHITSMAGTWLSVIKGFAGQRSRNGKLAFSPWLPDGWDSLKFNLRYRGKRIHLNIKSDALELKTSDAEGFECYIYNELVSIQENELKSLPLKTNMSNVES